MTEAQRWKLRDFARRRQRVYLEMQGPLSPRSAHRLMFWRSIEAATSQRESINMDAWARWQRDRIAKTDHSEAVAIQLRNAETEALRNRIATAYESKGAHGIKIQLEYEIMKARAEIAEKQRKIELEVMAEAQERTPQTVTWEQVLGFKPHWVKT